MSNVDKAVTFSLRSILGEDGVIISGLRIITLSGVEIPIYCNGGEWDFCDGASKAFIELLGLPKE